MVVKFDAALAIVPLGIPPGLGAKAAADDLIVSATSNDLSPRRFRPFRIRVFDQGLQAGTFGRCVGR